MIGTHPTSNALLLLISTIDTLVLGKALAKFDLKAIFSILSCYSAWTLQETNSTTMRSHIARLLNWHLQPI